MLSKQTKDAKRCKRKLIDLVAAYKGLSANKDKIEAALEKQQDKTASRQRELADMHKKDMSVKDRLAEALQRKIKDNNDVTEESRKRMDTLAAEVSNLEDQLAAGEASGRKAVFLTEALDTATAENKAHIKNLTERDARIQELEAASHALSQRSEELELSMKQKAVDLNTQIEINATLRDTLKQRGSSNGESDIKLASTVAALKENEVALQESGATIAGLRAKLTAAQSELEMNLADASRTTSRVIEKELLLQQDLDAAMLLRAKQDADLEETRTLLVAAQREVTALKRRVESDAAAHREAATSLEGELAAERDKAQAAHKGSSSSSDELRQLRSETRALRGELKQRTDVATRELRELREEVLQLQDENGDLETRVQSKEAALSRAEENAARQSKRLTTAESTAKAQRDELAKLGEDIRAGKAAISSARSEAQSESQRCSALQQLVSTFERTANEKEQLFELLKQSKDDLEQRLLAKSETQLEANAEVAALQINLDAEVASKEAAVKARLAQAERDSDTLDELRSKLADVELALKDQTVAFSGARRDIAGAQAREAGLDSKVAILQKAIAEGKAEAATLAASLASANSDASEEATSNTQLQGELATATANAEHQGKLAAGYKESRDELEKQLATTKDQLKQIVDKLRQEESSSASHQYTSETQSTALATLREDKVALAAKVAALGVTLAQTKIERDVEIEALQNSNATLEQTLDSQQIELQALQDLVDQSTISSVSLRRQLADADTTAGELRQSNTQLTVDLATATTRLSAVQASGAQAALDISELRGRIKEADAELASTREESATFKLQVGALTKDNDEISATLTAKVEEHARVTKVQQQHTTELKKMLKGSSVNLAAGKDLEPGLPRRDNSSGGNSATSSASGSGSGTPQPTSSDSGAVSNVYLKNVLIKYMTSRNAEGKHLLKVIATIMKFSHKELRTCQSHLDEVSGSWLNWG